MMPDTLRHSRLVHTNLFCKEVLTKQVLFFIIVMLSFLNSHAKNRSGEFHDNVQSIITTHPQSQTACLGSSVTFSVVSNQGSPAYQWRKNGVNISGATNASYTISNVDASNAGSYDCKVNTELSNVAVLTIPNPIKPEVTTPVRYCLNSEATPLSAQGDNLLWVNAVETTQNLGPSNRSSYSNGGQRALNSNELRTMFNVEKNIKLKSVTVFPYIYNTGNRTLSFRIRNSSGTIIANRSIIHNFTSTGIPVAATVVELNLDVPVGNNYTLEYSDGPDLHWGQTGLSYSNAIFKGNGVVITGPIPSIAAWAPTSLGIFNWQFSSSDVEYSTQTPTPNTTIAGTYTFNVVASQGTCYSAPSEITVHVSSAQSPTLVITNPAPNCTGNAVDLTSPGIVSGSSGGLTFSYWHNNEASVLLNNPSSVSTSGTYYIKGSLDDNCFKIKPVSVIVSQTNLWLGTENNNWHNSNNWCAGIPGENTDLEITNGTNNPLISNGDAVCREIIIRTNAVLTIQNNRTLNVKGNWESYGSFDAQNQAVAFTGSSNQRVKGSTSFPDLTVNKSAGSLIIDDTTIVRGTLRLISGQVVSNDKLSIDLNSGNIHKEGNGNISGKITVIKNINRDLNTYIAMPLSNVKVKSIHNTVPILTGRNANLFWYDESIPNPDRNIGWKEVSNHNNVLEKGKGYTLKLSTPSNLYLTGDYDHNTSFDTLFLTNTLSAKASSDGWNFIGNPYPETIDWDSPNMFRSNNVENAIYIYSQTSENTGNWNYYINGESILNGSRYIGSMQGFWVKVNEPGVGKIHMHRESRTNFVNPPVYRLSSQSSSLKLSVSHNNLKDELVLKLAEEATTGFDPKYDAKKMLNSQGSVSIYSHSEGDNYAINSFNEFAENMVIPLSLYAPLDGIYTFKPENINSFDTSYDVYFEDKISEKLVNLRESSEVSMMMEKGFSRERFYVHFYPAKAEEIISSSLDAVTKIDVRIYNIDQTAYVKINDCDLADIQVYDLLGREIIKYEGADLSSGLFSFNLPKSKEIFIIKVTANRKMYTGKIISGK
ncbi:MAG: immunoglobulin domain-containing protein [Cytophagaceae bacterium]